MYELEAVASDSGIQRVGRLNRAEQVYHRYILPEDHSRSRQLTLNTLADVVRAGGDRATQRWTKRARLLFTCPFDSHERKKTETHVGESTSKEKRRGRSLSERGLTRSCHNSNAYKGGPL